MPSITGIELGPDSCVVVRARPHAGGAEISAFHLIEPSAWPAHDTGVIAVLRGLRRSKGFPRHARVVAWGLSEPVRLDDPIAQSLVKPIAAAGFRVDAILTAPEALAEIARTRPRGPGVAAVWMALNRHGAALAIVRDGELLFGRMFPWHYSSDVVGTRAELLQRYSLVAHLAPEVRRGITLVKRAHGAIVEALVTCGDLPDLRSLTMPLIEELDLEVETLDSTEGLCATVKARLERLAESAPAVRLATAAATSGVSTTRRRSPSYPWLRVAAAAVIVGTIAWRGYSYWSEAPARPVAERVAGTRPPSATLTAGISSATTPQVSAAPAPTSSSSPAVPPVAPPTTVPSPPTPVASQPALADTKRPAPAATPAPVPPPAQTTQSVERAIKPTGSEVGPKPQSSQASAIPPARPSGEAAPKPQSGQPPPPPAQPASPKPSGDAASRPQSSQTQQLPAQPASPKPTGEGGPKPTAERGPTLTAESRNKATGDAGSKPSPVEDAPKPNDERGAKPAGAAEPVMESISTRPNTPRRPVVPVPLKEAVPTVDSILVSPDRRVAIVGGQIVTVGDRVGSRLVAGIERDTVVLQEPSGYRIFVRIRRRSGGD